MNKLQESLETIFNAQNGGAISHEDKLGHNLMLTLERRKATVDWLISSRSNGHVKGRTRRVLAWAIVEILWMSGVPAPAVVDTAVDFVKRHHSASEAGFVNSFLRRLLEAKSAGLEAMLAQAPPHVRFDLPEILWKRWCVEHGESRAAELAETLLCKAKVVLRRKTWPLPQPDVPATLIHLDAPEWAPWAELYTPGPQLHSLDEFNVSASGFYIQDMATLLAPTLLAPRPGEDIADLCCAPGGKSRILAEMLKGTGNLFCGDKSEGKLPRVRENMEGLQNVTIHCLDASAGTIPGKFDGILLDVPCSNTGVIRRKPDARWGFSTAKLAELTCLQALILENAATALKPKGRIVYSTCSIENDENEKQIDLFLSKHSNFKLAENRLILPTKMHDGAFAALLISND